MRPAVAVFSFVTALLAGTLAGSPPASAGLPPIPAEANPTPMSSGPAPTTEVTLITGDRVVITSQRGRQAIAVTAADRGPATAPVSFSSFVVRGDTYVVPSDAAAYVGGQLSWSLFDVSALVRGGYTNGTVLPLTVSYQTGAQRRTLPGLNPRHAGPPGADIEQPRNGVKFGAAVAAQLQADVARAHSQPRPRVAGQQNLFSGVRSISLDSAKARTGDPTPAGNRKPDPGFDMQTLTLNAIGRDGRAPSRDFAGDDGFFLVADVDDPAGFTAEIPVTPTRQNWSVPAGSYDIRAFIFTWFQKTITIENTDGTSDVETVWDNSMSFVWRPQVSIRSDTSLTFDARTATKIPIPRTPDGDTTAGWRVPGTNCCIPQFELVSDRVAPDGTDLPWYWMSGAQALEGDTVGLEVYATPSAQRVRKGSRHFYTYQRLESPATGHTYDLQYPTRDGSVPTHYATQTTTSQLAAVPTTYSSEVPDRTGGVVRFGYQPWETENIRDDNLITEPLHRTEYVLADKASRTTLWQESAELSDDIQYPGADTMFGRFTAYRPGPQRAVRWFDGPRHPGVEQPGPVVPPGAVGGPMTCPACRNATTLGFNIMPYVDGAGTDWGPALNAGNPLHGTQKTDNESLQLFTNGVLTAEQTTATDPRLGSGPTSLPLSPGRANYQIDYTVARDTPWSSLSTLTTTKWNFSSTTPRRSDQLPADWTCGSLVGTCAFIPLLLLDYKVPLDGHDSVHAPGTVTFTVHAYHQPHAPSTAKVDVPTVSVSYDDGANWQPVKSVAPAGHDTFGVRITTPDPSSTPGFVSLKVADSDSSGADISQTTIRAFTLSGSAASRGAGVGTAPPPPGGGEVTSGDRQVCATPAAGNAACDAIVHTTATGAPAATPTVQVTTASPPPGYGPADLASAYHLPKHGGTGQTIAVVDAAGDPNIVDDLAAYRAQYGQPACTTRSGCLQVVGQSGGTPPVGGNQNWGVETALDLDMVSAACPGCRILLVVADTPSFGDLATAEHTATRLGASAISNSYGSYEQVGVRKFAAAYRPKGVTVVASSGDAGFGFDGTLGGTQFPASVPAVTAVGGTRLAPDAGASRGWDETTWSGGGSGCSAYFAKPAFQRDPNCHMRTVTDISAVADPDTGVAAFDSALTTGGGWLVVGGTSVAAPLIAGMYGLAGNATTVQTPRYLYRHASQFTDITSGSNGYCASPVNYLCNAKKGYDAPTGLGTPNGVGGL